MHFIRQHIFIIFLVLIGFSVSGQDSILINQLASEYNSAQSDSVRLRIILNLLNSSKRLDDVDTAIQIAQKGLELAKNQNDSLAMAESQMHLGVFFLVQSKFNEALNADLEALKIFQTLQIPEQEARVLNAIGEDYFFLDLHNEAYGYYKRCQELAEENGIDLYEAISLYNLGKLFIAKEEIEKAKRYIEESMQMSSEIGDTVGIAYSKNDLALILINQGKYEEALNELKDAYDISESLNEDILTPQIVVTMAKAHQAKGDYKKALDNYDKAFKIYTKHNNRSGLGSVLYGKGNVSEAMGNLVQSKKYYDQCIEVSEEIDDHDILIKCYEALATLYENENDYRLALDYYRKFKTLEDSIFSEKKEGQFKQLQMQNESARKDVEIQKLNQKEQQQIDEIKHQEFVRNILVLILAFTGVLLFSLYKNNIKRRKINEVLVAQQAEIKAKSKELSSLLEVKDKFFSIVSHDLRSPINSLIGILEIMDKEKISEEELKSVSHALRVRLSNTKKLLDTLLDWAMLQMNEIKIIKENINLSEIVDLNLNFFKDIGEKNIQFINDLANKEQLVLADKNMLDLIIRNIISNSIKFTEVGGKVKVYSKEESEDTITVFIEDNGVGMDKDQMDTLFDTSELYTTRGTANEKGTGLGLRLCKEFVEKMGGKIWVESTVGKGSIFKFTLNKA